MTTLNTFSCVRKDGNVPQDLAFYINSKHNHHYSSQKYRYNLYLEKKNHKLTTITTLLFSNTLTHLHMHT